MELKEEQKDNTINFLKKGSERNKKTALSQSILNCTASIIFDGI